MSELRVIADCLYLDGEIAAYLAAGYCLEGTPRHRLEQAIGQSPDIARMENDLDEAKFDIDHLKRALRRVDKAIDENRLDDAKQLIGEALC